MRFLSACLGLSLGTWLSLCPSWGHDASGAQAPLRLTRFHPDHQDHAHRLAADNAPLQTEFAHMTLRPTLPMPHNFGEDIIARRSVAPSTGPFVVVPARRIPTPAIPRSRQFPSLQARWETAPSILRIAPGNSPANAHILTKHPVKTVTAGHPTFIHALVENFEAMTTGQIAAAMPALMAELPPTKMRIYAGKRTITVKLK